MTQCPPRHSAPWPRLLRLPCLAHRTPGHCLEWGARASRLQTRRLRSAGLGHAPLQVGNLPPEATEVELSTLFTQLLSACEGYNPILGPPCPNASIAGGHTFAFVEFRDEQLCGAPCAAGPRVEAEGGGGGRRRRASWRRWPRGGGPPPGHASHSPSRLDAPRQLQRHSSGRRSRLGPPRLIGKLTWPAGHPHPSPHPHPRPNRPPRP